MEAKMCKCGCGKPCGINRGDWANAYHKKKFEISQLILVLPLCGCGCGEFVEPTIFGSKVNRYKNGHLYKTPNMRIARSEELKGNARRLGILHTFKTKEKMSLSRIKYQNDNPALFPGKTITGGGYQFIRMPEHPKANRNGYVKEEWLTMERYLGRFLTKDEVVHHRNENKLDNRIENLELFTDDSAHTSYHTKDKHKRGIYAPERRNP